MTETLPPSTRRGLSGTALKGIACVTMLIDHIGASCLENGFLSAPAAPAGLDTGPGRTGHGGPRAL